MDRSWIHYWKKLLQNTILHNMTSQLTTEQLQALGMNALSHGQREDFLARIGKTVFDSALVALLETLNDEQIHALNHALEANESMESIVSYLQVTYPRFISYMQEVQDRFVSEYMKAMQATA